MQFWKSGRMMQCLWIGCIVMGLTYAIFFREGNGALAFSIGQVVLGLIGLARESAITSAIKQS